MKFAPQIRFAFLLGVALGCVPPAVGQVSPDKLPKESPARAEIEKLIGNSGADVAVAFRSLDSAQELFIQPDKQFHAANTIIQIPVMIELYAEAQAGELRLSDALRVHNNFRSIVDGSTLRLDPKDDPDPDVYRAIGKTMTLRELCGHMITRNSNLAGSLLIEKLGVDRIRERLHALRADGVQLVRGFEGRKANDKGPDNTTSARGVMELLWALTKGEAISPEASQEMIGVMAHSSSQRAAAAGPPSDTRAAQKSVEIAGANYQAMVVYGPHSFVLAILTNGVADPGTGSALMAQIAHALAAGVW